MATTLGNSHEKTSTLNSVPKLRIAGIISKNLYNQRSLRFFMSLAFEISKYSFLSIIVLLVALPGFEPGFYA